jgi:hypothetical protein
MCGFVPLLSFHVDVGIDVDLVVIRSSLLLMFVMMMMLLLLLWLLFCFWVCVCQALFADGDFVSTYGKDKIVSIMIERMAAAQVVMDNGNDATNGAQTDFYDWKGVMGQVRVVLKIKWLDVSLKRSKVSGIRYRHSLDHKQTLPIRCPHQ